MAYTRVSDANEITERYMDSILIEERLIDSVKADLKTTFLGETFDMPVMTPAFSHLGNYNGREYTGLEEYSMAAKDSSGMIVMPDKDEAFEEKIAVGSDISGKDVSADIRVSGVSYNISSDGVLTAKAELTADITSGGSSSITAVTDIVVDASSKKQRDGDYAVKLYFGIENENVWDIAKRYSTSVDAVMEENELNGEKLENGGMLLIPIKE